MSTAGALSHTQYVLINRLATPAGAFIILIIIGRYSDVLLGQYALVMTFYYIMQMLPLLGLTSYVMREVARKPEQAGKFFVSIGALSLLGCVAVDVLCAAFLHFIDYPKPVNHGIAVTGVLIFPGILLFIAEIIFMSLGRAKPVAQGAVTENIIRVILSLAVLHYESGLVALIWVFFFTRFGTLLYYLHTMRRQGLLTGFQKPDRAVLRATLQVLPGFLIGTVFFVVFSRMDFLVLSLYREVETIAYYAIGYRLFDIGLVVLTGLIMAVFPWISRKFAGSQQHFRVAMRDISLLLVAGLLFISFSGVLLGEFYVRIFFASQYPRPVLLTQLFFVALFFSGLDFVASSILHASDRQTWDTKASAIGGVVNVALLFSLIPDFGIYGAFAAKLASTMVQGLFKIFMVEQATGQRWRQSESLALGLVIAAVTLLGVLVLHAPLLWKLVVIVLLGLVLLPALFMISGLFRPLRLLRFYWRPRGAQDVISIQDLIDVIVSDARRTRNDRLDRSMFALITQRLASYFDRRDRSRLAGILARLAGRLAAPGEHLPELTFPLRVRASSLPPSNHDGPRS